MQRPFALYLSLRLATEPPVKASCGASAYWKHLRLPFQLTLAPLFLWGAFLADARLELPFATGFISLHLFLYPGITAFNSAYDQDVGPVSGMLEPPPVPPRLLGVSLGMQAAGAVLAATVGAAFLSIYCAIALLAAGYSHPRTRWKASPWASAATVALGQGLLGFLAGWCAAVGGLPDVLDPRALLGGATAALTTLGLYPPTQVFQVDEDAARGDRTLAVTLGPVRALHLGSFCLLAAGALATWLVGIVSGALGTLLIAGAYAAIIGYNELFAHRIRTAALDVQTSFRWAMRTSIVATGAFMAFIAHQLLGE